jgi:predicted tellurium resistance membrane protein TerC
MAAALLQIILLDAVFSIDSVITAIGMAEHTQVMIIAVVLSVALMLVIARPIGSFVERHPTVKMLALSFLLLIGVALIADGLGHHVPRGYIYFALVFSVLVEALNLRTARGRRAA